MPIPNQKQRSVALHDFGMVPSGNVPRSQFNLSHGRKVPFSFSNLVPILCELAIPGDTWNCNISVAARTAVPLVPVQDNWHLEYFSFFIPMRLVWANSHKFFGEQANPGDSINFTIPKVTGPAGGFPINSIWDYFGIPCIGQANNNLTVNTLPLRCYTRVYNEWFRDENLQSSLYSPTDDGPDTQANYILQRRGKRPDYITQALPWPQKGATAITIPLGGQAPIRTSGTELVTTGANSPTIFRRTDNNALPSVSPYVGVEPGTGQLYFGPSAAGGALTKTSAIYPSNLYADLQATSAGATINAMRTSITLQQYLEQDARGGTRYTEYVWNNWKVRTQDSRINRPEFIGGGYAPINTVPIAQTSATGLTGATTPIGTLAATGYVQGGRAGFTYSATEHGYILTLVSARVDQTYSQGLRRMWTINTRYDLPVPLLAGLGEQTLYNYEVYCDGTANDGNAFGYVPRFDEFRFIPSTVVGLYRPTAAGNIAYWHSSQLFGALPTLASAFITDDSLTTVQRNFSAGASSLNQQIMADFYFDIRCARALPLYGVPGLTRL